jgi:hypothetical protein
MSPTAPKYGMKKMETVYLQMGHSRKEMYRRRRKVTAGSTGPSRSCLRRVINWRRPLALRYYIPVRGKSK